MHEPHIFRTRGQLNISILKPTGQVEQHCVKNLLVDTGRHFIADRIMRNQTPPISRMAIGIGATWADAGDIALQAELARVPVTISKVGSVLIYTAVFGKGVGTGAITEAGLFNEFNSSETQAILVCRSVFGVKTKDPEDVITIGWEIHIEAA